MPMTTVFHPNRSSAVPTLATKKQSEAIKHRMAEIRTDLPYDVDDARSQLRELTDWKHHLRSHPVMILGTIAAISFLVVPSGSGKRSGANHGSPHHPSRGDDYVPAKKSIFAGLISAAATMALRSGATFAQRQLMQKFLDRSASMKRPEA